MPIFLNPILSQLPETILIHGSFGAGKSVTAMTASDFIPKDAPMPFRVRPHVVLHDMIWVMADTDAMAGFEEMGFIVPKENIIDFSHVEPSEIVACLNELINSLKKIVERVTKEGHKPKIVFDSLGAIDILIGAFWTQRIEGNASSEDSAQSKKDNNFAFFRAVLNTHTPFLVRVKALAAQKFFLCHQSVKGEVMKSKDSSLMDQQERKRNAAGFTEGAIAASLTGKAWEYYHQQCSLVIAVERITTTKMVAGKPTKEYSRIVRPHGKADLITKTRYSCLLDSEPADFRVINAKILESKK